MHFLLKDALKQLKERGNMEAEEEEERWMAQVKAMTVLSRRLPRKRKKKMKRKLPRSSSHSSLGRARRRLRQWHARYAGLPGDVPFRAVFPSVVVRPTMLGIMAVMNQKDSTTLVVNYGSGTCRVAFTGYDALCVMFHSGVAKPKSILAGMDQIMVQTAETVVVPQLQSIQVVDIPFVPQRQFPMVQTIQQTTEIPQMPFVFRWSMPLLCRSCLPYLLLSTTGAQGSDSAEIRRGPAVAVHQVRRHLPVVVQKLIPKIIVTMEVPQLQFIDRSCSSSFSVVEETVEIPQLQLVVFFGQAQMQIPLVYHSDSPFAVRW